MRSFHSTTVAERLPCESYSGVATSAIDLSDGLLGDLDHILELSAVGAEVDEAALPLAPLIAACDDPIRAFQACTAGGDDYELVFTSPAARHAQIAALSLALDLPLTQMLPALDPWQHLGGTQVGVYRIEHELGQLGSGVQIWNQFFKNNPSIFERFSIVQLFLRHLGYRALF